MGVGEDSYIYTYNMKSSAECGKYYQICSENSRYRKVAEKNIAVSEPRCIRGPVFLSGICCFASGVCQNEVPVFPVVFYPVHGGIRKADRLFCAQGFSFHDSKINPYGADAAVNGQAAVTASYYKTASRFFLNLSQALVKGTDVVRFFYDYKEFIAADPADGAFGFPGQQGGQEQQHLISYMVSVLVIKYFEIVDIQEKNSHFRIF